MQLAWPMLIGQVAQLGTGVADTIMAGAVGPTDLAAVAVGFSIWLPTYILCIGVLSAVTARIARAFGAGDQAAKRSHFSRASGSRSGSPHRRIALIPYGHLSTATDASRSGRATAHANSICTASRSAFPRSWCFKCCARSAKAAATANP